MPGAGARAPGQSHAREPASRRKWVPPLPSSAPSRRRLLPSHRRVLRARVRNVTGGSRREGQNRAAGREHGCTRPPSPGGGEGDRAGKEGVRGEAGQGQARGPARKARALGPRGRYRCHRQDAPRPGRPLASPSPPDSPRPSPHPTASSTTYPTRPPATAPSPFVAASYRSQNVTSAAQHNICAPSTPLRVPRPPTGLGGRRGAIRPIVPLFPLPQRPPLPSSLLPPPPPSPSGA